ncbi:hypothetical protein, partial [Pseudomonas sp. AKS31]|uniref:hypothetical protein n=1 Tax=Pseudomonas sp. AKS31 TaxID=2949091 RepID=UPI00202A5993
TAPEVGRIIDILNLPSTVNFAFLSNHAKSPFYIDVTATNAQYIAQYQNKTLLFLPWTMPRNE